MEIRNLPLCNGSPLSIRAEPYKHNRPVIGTGTQSPDAPALLAQCLIAEPGIVNLEGYATKSSARLCRTAKNPEDSNAPTI